MVLASQTFSSDFRSAPFIGGPHACNTPAIRMSGYSSVELTFCIVALLEVG